MKIAIWALLGLNAIAAVLVAMGFALPAATPSEPPGPAPSATRLELLSELPSPPARLDELAEATPPAPAPGDSPGFSDATPAVAEAPHSPPTAAESRVSEPVPATTEPDRPARDETVPAPQPPDVPARADLTPDSGPTPLVQAPGGVPPIDEPDPKAGVPVAQPTPASPSVPADAGPDPNAAACFRTAEFAPEAKSRIEGSLRAAGFEQMTVRATNRARYWVYWSGERGAADGLERTLRTAGVKDWYRVGGGPGVTVSLGVYGQIGGARLRQRQLAAKGVEADVAERYPPQARLRLQITAPPGAAEAAMAGLTRDGVRLEPCP